MSVAEYSVDTLWLLISIFATLPPSFRHLPLPMFYHMHHQDMQDCTAKPQCKHAVNTTHKHRTWQSTNQLNKGAENRGRMETQQLLPRIFRQASAELPQKSVRKHHRQLLLLHLLHNAYSLLPVCASTNSFRELFRDSSAELPRPASQNTCKTNRFL